MRTSNIPDSNLDNRTVKNNGNTQDIINTILKQDKIYYPNFEEFSKQFNGRKGLEKLWNFVKYEIKYKIDPNGEQIIKSPKALWKLKQGDCKSKTLFVNQVLKHLKIPYKIRFVNYDPDITDVKHVYTVALINGSEVPIDTVYDQFGVEKKYNLKKDFMTKISTIEGIGNTDKRDSKEVLKQKQDFIGNVDILPYQKLSGSEVLKINMLRELEILSVMDEKNSSEYKKGIDLVKQSMAGKQNFVNARVSPFLNSTLSRLIQEDKKPNKPALSNGLQAQKIEKFYKESKTKKQKSSIGFSPHRECLALYFRQPILVKDQNSPLFGQYNFTEYRSANPSANGGNCISSGYEQLGSLFESGYVFGNPANEPNWGAGALGGDPLNFLQGFAWEDFHIWYYGSTTKYRKSLKDFKNDFYNTLNILQNDPTFFTGRGNNTQNGDSSVYFDTEAGYKATMEALNLNSGVLSDWIQDVLRSDHQNTQGCVGTVFNYKFTENAGIQTNALPQQVALKRILQNRWLYNATLVSGLDQTNIDQMIRNCYLYDIGVQPEQDLQTLFQYYTQPSVGEPISAAIIIAIIGAIVKIGTFVASAIIDGQNNAKQIDPTLDNVYDPSQNLTTNDFAQQNDWQPLQPVGSGSGSGSGSGLINKQSSVGLFVLLAGAGLLLANQNKKK